jgi:hypothetical protein
MPGRLQQYHSSQSVGVGVVATAHRHFESIGIGSRSSLAWTEAGQRHLVTVNVPRGDCSLLDQLDQ